MSAPAIDEYGRAPGNGPAPAPYGVLQPAKCSGCGYWVEPLSVFPGSRCQLCHGNDPAVRASLATMTGEGLARLWGAH